ncbi:hypothetical protein CTAYLR_008539 [Chrysophaeum taylorii]|uniref:Uncharacterized protein n=1 Tax=Chrysophaeum taylorii TaxID=2483200 RepID=A0AAD7U6T1_9STRA|nr:hypothetical protein CTAYLR_008539 [Chrysophaeum taylorii]
MALALPYCSLGSLDVVVARADEAWRVALALDAATGVAAAHAAGIVVRDVKPANILVDEAGVGRLCDLELAGTPEELEAPVVLEARCGPSRKRRRFEGTPEYLSPEQLAAYFFGEGPDPMRAASTSKSDVYALAVTINEIATTVPPFSDQRVPVSSQTVVEVSYTPRAICRDVIEGKRPTLLGDSIAASRALVRSGWAQRPDDRRAANDFLRGMLDHALSSSRQIVGFEPALRRASSNLRTDTLVIPADVRRPYVDAAVPPPPLLPPAENDARPLSSEELRALEGLGGGAGGPRRSSADEAAVGRRDAMEDFAARVEWSERCACYVVADGHDGDRVARLAATALPPLLARALLATESPKRGVEDFQRLATDEPTAGACVVAALVVGRRLWTVHVGDCRALLLCDSRGFSTRDHSSRSKDISVARAVGASARRFAGVTTVPDAAEFEMPEDAVCLVLGSDGLFAHLSNADVAAVLWKTAPRADLAARALVAAALCHDANGDNVAVVVVYFDDRHLPPHIIIESSFVDEM